MLGPSMLEVGAPPSRLCKRLLVVEDDEDHRATLCEILEEEGYCTETAGNGRDALERLSGAGSLPDLILVDMLMPVMDGWALMAELKKHPVLATIPVLAISGGGDRVLSSAPVAAGYLVKPLSRSRLLETISCCLLRRRRASDPCPVTCEP
jgi:CheY-like chemotaxis protein